MTNDFWEAKIAERQWLEKAVDEQRLLNSTDWGSEGCESFSQIVKNCIERGSGSTRFKSSVFKDCSFSDAIDEALIELGLSADETQLPSFKDSSDEFEIQF